jgi:hypothetical protein
VPSSPPSALQVGGPLGLAGPGHLQKKPPLARFEGALQAVLQACCVLDLGTACLYCCVAILTALLQHVHQGHGNKLRPVASSQASGRVPGPDRFHCLSHCHTPSPAHCPFPPWLCTPRRLPYGSTCSSMPTALPPFQTPWPPSLP